MRVLLWDVHGGYSDALLSGDHEYLFLPAEEGRGGLARYRGAPPPGARELAAADLRDAPPDLVLLQRREEVDICQRELGLTPGRDVSAVFLEHNTPRMDVPNSGHPLAGMPGLTIVHVTHFNNLLWDCGETPTRVIEHGVADPGPQYTGSLPHLAFVVNEPVRRWRVTGTDLLPHFGAYPIDTWGIDGDRLPPVLAAGCPELRFAGNVQPDELYAALAQRRAYLHLNRWTSLGLSLIQAMMLGLPVLVLDTTEASRAVPAAAGARSCDLADLVRGAEVLLTDGAEAARRGAIGRAAALARYGLPRFLRDWDQTFAATAGTTR